MIKVVHCKKAPYDVLIDRRTKWGNPYIMDGEEDRERVIKEYENYILNCPELLDCLCELKDKTLGCWCKPKNCHGDVLKKLVEKYCK